MTGDIITLYDTTIQCLDSVIELRRFCVLIITPLHFVALIMQIFR